MRIKKPVFIIGCPRSGTTLLYTILKASTELWSASGESHFVWEKFLPDKRDFSLAFVLSASDFKDGDRQYLENQYHQWTTQGDPSMKPSARKYTNPFGLIWYPRRIFLFLSKLFSRNSYRVLDKTPPNTYRIDYLAKAFPDARFIYLTRDAAANISSLIEGWRSKTKFKFRVRKFYDYNRYINIKGYDGDVWKFTNPPGWKAYLNKSLEDVCAFQWLSAHQYALDSFARLDPARVCRVKYEELIADPSSIIKELCDFIEIPYDEALQEQVRSLPVVATATKPESNKWLKNKTLIDNIAQTVDEMQLHLGYPSLILELPIKTSVEIEHSYNLV